MSTIVKYKDCTTRSLVDQQNYEAGSLLVAEDTNELFLDSLNVTNKRIRIGSPGNLSTANLNNMIETGRWLTRNGGSLTNLPAQTLGLLEVINADDYAIQRYIGQNGNIYIRIGTIANANSISWGSWRTI